MTYSVEVIVFIALALYLVLLLYFKVQGEKIIMKLNPNHTNSQSTHERDLISRADAIGAVGKYKEEHGYAYYDCACDIENDLKQLPSASVEWIPCSERLPENGHYYLWCSDMGHVQSDYYWDGFENGMKYEYNIVAWMPLPKPYREDGDDEII